MNKIVALGQRAASTMSSAVETASNQFRMHTGAMDVIVVMSPDGSLRSTDWHVQIGRDAHVPLGSGAQVRVFINDKLEEKLTMEVGSDGRCFFPASPIDEDAECEHHLSGQECEHHLSGQVLAHRRGGESFSPPAGSPASRKCLQPDAAVLAVLNLEMGRNELRYEIMNQTSLLDTTVSLFLWDSDDQVVVLHVETAVLRRAALAKGAQTLSFGKHSGQCFGWDTPWAYVCELMVYMDTAGYRLLLLTSTPITWCDKVRHRLSAIRGYAGRRDDDDDELRLPAAALLSTCERSFRHTLSSFVAQAGSFQTEALAGVLAAFGIDDDAATHEGENGFAQPRQLRAHAHTREEEAHEGGGGGRRVRGEGGEEGGGQEGDREARVPKVAGHIGAFGAAAVLHHLAPAPFSWSKGGGRHSLNQSDTGPFSPMGYRARLESRVVGRRVIAGAFGDAKVDAGVFEENGVPRSRIFCVSDKGVVSSCEPQDGAGVFPSYKAILQHLPALFPPTRGRYLTPAFVLPPKAGWGDGSGGQLEHKALGGVTYRTNAVPHASSGFNCSDESSMPNCSQQAPMSAAARGNNSVCASHVAAGMAVGHAGRQKGESGGGGRWVGWGEEGEEDEVVDAMEATEAGEWVEASSWVEPSSSEESDDSEPWAAQGECPTPAPATKTKDAETAFNSGTQSHDTKTKTPTASRTETTDPTPAEMSLPAGDASLPEPMERRSGLSGGGGVSGVCGASSGRGQDEGRGQGSVGRGGGSEGGQSGQGGGMERASAGDVENVENMGRAQGGADRYVVRGGCGYDGERGDGGGVVWRERVGRVQDTDDDEWM